MSIAATFLHALAARATCRYIQANAGDGCWALAQRCGITQDQLTSYNPSPFSCNTIQKDDYVCCSSGTPPDFSPQPQSNGDCFVYTVQDQDTCSIIATNNKIKDWHKLEDVNKKTWGWSGCGSMQKGMKMCLSTGNPPFPAPVTGNVCGPQKPGTTKPTSGTSDTWANLNPCPLNACCDVWGQCGITSEFCTATPADTGAPGTAKPYTNGCISNCGVDIKQTGARSGTPMRVGYFESWNFNRKCLHMDVSSINKNYYTHVHWGFANLTSDWHVDVSGAGQEFDNFRALTGIKRILSFGGWAFSTEQATIDIFRSGVKTPANREAFASNVVKFITDAGLDGVDFDWEYPGAQDINNNPDSTLSGFYYALFLALVKSKLANTGKTVSIAAPASFWYLKNFPISYIATQVDYIIYMTYDLHGQWDYNNKFVDPGCIGGNCLRHHVNDTEIVSAFSMITKAGVPLSKIVVGMPTYGRSFKMTKAGCTGPMCTYTGPLSGAAKGRCTDTAGYISNSEIYEIIADRKSKGQAVQQYYDTGDIVVYDQTEWVSWMTPTTYKNRQIYTDAIGFAGTSDWAIDLNGTISDASTPVLPNPDDGGYLPETWAPCDLTLTFTDLTDLSNRAGGLRTDCVNLYTMQVLINMLQQASDDYNNVNDGYDKMWGYYVTYMKKLVPEIAAHAFIFNVTKPKLSGPPDPGFGLNYYDCQVDRGSSGKWPCSDIGKHVQEMSGGGTTTMTVRDLDGLNKAYASVGIDPSWMTGGTHEEPWTLSGGKGGDRTVEYRFSNFPAMKSDAQISNPKDIITKGLINVPELQSQMMATYWDMILGQWINGNTGDALQAYSAPVFMMMQGVDSMKQAKDLGAKEEQSEIQEAKDRIKNIILLVVTVALIFVPVVGEEAATAAGLSTLARVIAIGGEVGNTALGIYDIVNDPSSAAVNILGMLLGLGNIAKAARDGPGLAGIAKWKRGMDPNAVGALGKIFKDNNDKLGNIAKMCKVR